MPATSLRCRACTAVHDLDAGSACSRCFGPLDPVYDWDALVGRVTRESIAAGPASIWRYADLLPVASPQEQRLPPGLTPLVAAPRLADALGVGERQPGVAGARRIDRRGARLRREELLRQPALLAQSQ